MPPNQNNQSLPYVYDSNSNQEISFWHRRPIKIILVLMVLVIILIIVISIVQRGKTPQSVASNFANKVISGQTTQTYQQASEKLRNSTPFSSWQSDVQTVGSLCSGKVILTSNTQNTATARELFTAKGKNSNNCHIEIDLINTSGKWLVNSFVAY